MWFSDHCKLAYKSVCPALPSDLYITTPPQASYCPTVPHLSPAVASTAHTHNPSFCFAFLLVTKLGSPMMLTDTTGNQAVFHYHA